MRLGSSQTSTLLAAIPTPGRDANTRSKAASHPGSASASLLSRAINSPRAAAIPWLLAAQKPRFRELRITRAPNSPAARSAEPSVEPLSTTIVSDSTPVCRASDARHARKSSFRFQLTTTTDTKRLCYQLSAFSFQLSAFSYQLKPAPPGGRAPKFPGCGSVTGNLTADS